MDVAIAPPLNSNVSYKNNMNERNLLFIKYDLRGTIDNVHSEISGEINRYESDYLLSVKLEDICAHLVDKHSFNPPQLFPDQVEMIDQGETHLPSEQFGRQVNLNANYFVFAVPFSGDGNLFYFRASTSSSAPPCGVVANGELHLKFVRTDHNGEAIKNALNRELEEILKHLSWIARDVELFHSNLSSTIMRQLEVRKEKLLKDKGIVTSLGIPIRQRKDAPQTFTTPVNRKQIHIPKPKAPKEPFIPEPALDDKVYEQIIETLQNMVLVMERSPHAFAGMGEEDLRTHFLVQLNGLYEGMATGETFNFEGKTDILIRAEGKNVFIGECKFWKGPKALHDTIDQLLGYVSWRDTKISLLIFNRNKELGKVLEQIPDVIKSHPNYKRGYEMKSETDFRFILKSNVDENKEMIASLLVFDIPT